MNALRLTIVISLLVMIVISIWNFTTFCESHPVREFRELWLGERSDSVENCLADKMETNYYVYGDMRRLVDDLFQNLNQMGVNYRLTTGSLLGLVRCGDMLPWDYDVDIMVDQAALIEKNSKFEKFNGIGPMFRYQFGFPYRDLHVDIYSPEKMGFWPVDKLLINNITLFGPSSISSFMGLPVRLPENYDEVLNLFYGNWSSATIKCQESVFTIEPQCLNFMRNQQKLSVSNL